MNQRYILRLLFIAMILFSGCRNSSIDDVSQHYQKHRDYPSLKKLFAELQLGMSQKEVIHLVGEPDYSPTAGQYYYSSNQKDENGCTVGLIVDYEVIEDEKYEDEKIIPPVLGALKNYQIIPICE